MIAFALVAITLNHLRLHRAYRLMLHGTGEQMAIHDLPPIADESGAILERFRRDVAGSAELADMRRLFNVNPLAHHHKPDTIPYL